MVKAMVLVVASKMTRISHFNMRYNKYRNIKTVIDGIKFDSKKEAARYQELLLMQKAGAISSLELQPSFELVGSVLWNGKNLRARKYRADFKYFDEFSRKTVVEDVKGVLTDVYKIKKQIFLTLYPEYTFIET